MENVVLFLGLPRMKNRFKTSVSEMRELKTSGVIDDILFVTWRNRMEKEDELIKYLDSAGVEIVLKKESPVGGNGNFWHQSRALDYGLREISSKSRVLKTRTDVHIEKDFVRDLFNKGVNKKFDKSGIFAERIWSPSFKIGYPFYMNDICFFGRKMDIKKLVNYDVRYGNGETDDHIFYIPTGRSEVARFIHPYVRQFSFLEQLLENYRHCQNSTRRLSRKRSEALIESRLESPIYSQFLSFYYKVCMCDFYFNSEPVLFKNMNNTSDKYLATNNKLFMSNFTSCSDQYAMGSRCGHSEWLESHFVNGFSEDVPMTIKNGIDTSFNEWSKKHLTDKKVKKDEERDEKFYDNFEYPENIASKWLSDNILKPLNISDESRRIYKYLDERIMNNNGE